MKTITLLTVLLSTHLAFAERLVLDNGANHSLNIENSEVAAFLNYPGLGDNDCGIAIRAHSPIPHPPIANLLKKVTIRGSFGGGNSHVAVVSNRSLRIQLRVHTYVDGILIKTNDGRSLREVIQETLGGDVSVDISSASCLESEQSFFIP